VQFSTVFAEIILDGKWYASVEKLDKSLCYYNRKLIGSVEMILG